MELMELQNLWLENNRKLDETLRLNREIMNKLLKAKPEKRLIRIKTEALITLILPFILLALLVSGVLDPNIKARSDIQFYLGTFLFGVTFLTNYFFTANYYRLLLKVDFSETLIEIKTHILKAASFKLKLTRISYLLMPFAIIGIFMILGMPIFSMKTDLPIQSYLPLLLIVLVFIGSAYVTFKFTVVERFRKLKQEISELEKLTKEND
jgi:hypothetical protein